MLRDEKGYSLRDATYAEGIGEEEEPAMKELEEVIKRSENRKAFGSNAMNVELNKIWREELHDKIYDLMAYGKRKSF